MKILLENVGSKRLYNKVYFFLWMSKVTWVYSTSEIQIVLSVDRFLYFVWFSVCLVLSSLN